QATLASLSVPRGINFDNLGNLYIAEQNGYSIRKINMSSGIITTIAGNAIIGDSASGDGGAATLAQLYGPTDIVVDTTGNLYISDMGNQLIRIVNTNGIINTVAGDGYKSSACCGGFSGDGGQATLAELNNPWGLLIDKSGSLIIADWYNHRIRKVSTPLLGINQIGIEHNFSIFPNPSNGDININGTNNIDEIKVTDVFGQNVYEVKAHITNTILLTLENAGVYFVTITSDKEVSAKKVIINK
ncbi:MAG TPA: T9SS type A sorting domain-containing protein, partial [Bacteroidia bacterium]|nr:T9SS type A sorting domain-containing protein [Bacteroidia bacterium]